MHMHAHRGPREVYCCHIWKFYEFASHYASAEHLSIPPPRWERNEEGCCAVLSFTLTLRGDQTTVAGSSLRNNAAYFFIRGFLMRPVKNQPPLTKTHSLEWTWKAGNHLFITVLKASKKKKPKTLWTTKEASSAGYGQISKQLWWFLVFLARWHPLKGLSFTRFSGLSTRLLLCRKEKKMALPLYGRFFWGGWIFFFYFFTTVLI